MTERRPFRVALVGKGGAGKSMISGTLARVLARRGHRVLALDSDPMPGLAFSLGISAGDEAMLLGYAERDPEGRWGLKPGLGADEAVHRAAREAPDGVRFIQFGKATEASLSPIVSSLQALWAVSQGLSRDEWTVVHDLSAGTRQAFAGWANTADVFLMVVEPTAKAILSARRLAGARAVAAGATFAVVANKVTGPDDTRLVFDALPGFEPAGAVPLDPAVAAAERRGVAPIDAAPDAPAIAAVAALAERLESLAGLTPAEGASA